MLLFILFDIKKIDVTQMACIFVVDVVDFINKIFLLIWLHLVH